MAPGTRIIGLSTPFPTKARKRRGVRIFMYVVMKDGGFSPNPFYLWCTLACCKPVIRRTAQRGDWVVGITPGSRPKRVVYAMKVSRVLTFAEYWKEARFSLKRPREMEGAPIIERVGDNCYAPTGPDSYRQLRWSVHWDKDNQRENAHTKARDTRGNVLVARRFSYFGVHARRFPTGLASLRFPGRGHRVKFTPREVAALLRFLERLPRGLLGRPTLWKEGDLSWQEGSLGCG